MKYTIYLIIGLPGSGKSYYLSKVNSDLIFDDINDIRSLPEKIESDIHISDINFCINETLEKAIYFLKNKYKNINIEKIFFENDVNKCWKNVIERNDGRIISKEFLNYLSKQYFPPEMNIKIWENYDGK